MSFFLWIPALPIVAICIVGLVLASRKLGSYPRALRFAQAGFASLILRTIISASGQTMIIGLRGQSATEIGKQLATINVASYVLLAAGIAFLAVAAVADRPAVS